MLELRPGGEVIQVMGSSGQAPPVPATAAGAAAMAVAALGWLAAADATALTAAGQAGVLRALERAESMHTAARSRVLSAFTTGGGFEDDGHGSAKTWLGWQTRITRGAAAGAMGWARRLAAHPAVRAALAPGRSPGRGHGCCARGAICCPRTRGPTRM